MFPETQEYQVVHMRFLLPLCPNSKMCHPLHLWIRDASLDGRRLAPQTPATTPATAPATTPATAPAHLAHLQVHLA